MRNPISNTACQNVRREIEEAAPGEPLSLAVTTHIESCAACETLSREQSKLQAIISSLGTVEAPGDFDFRLRARLAGERNGSARPLALGDFSWGFRSAAVTMVLLAIGTAFVVVSFRTRLGSPAAGDGPVVSKPATPTSGAEAVQGGGGVKPSGSGADVVSKNSKPAAEDGLGSREGTQKRRVGRDELVASKGGRPSGTRETGFTPAKVLKAYDEARDSYPTAAFPIDASYQSLKMSVDNGRGSSRTISLPTVSFGSQQTLSQSGSPLMASARGAW